MTGFTNFKLKFNELRRDRAVQGRPRRRRCRLGILRRGQRDDERQVEAVGGERERHRDEAPPRAAERGVARVGSRGAAGRGADEAHPGRVAPRPEHGGLVGAVGDERREVARRRRGAAAVVVVVLREVVEGREGDLETRARRRRVGPVACPQVRRRRAASGS